jgi:hypothetical protein
MVLGLYRSARNSGDRRAEPALASGGWPAAHSPYRQAQCDGIRVQGFVLVFPAQRMASLDCHHHSGNPDGGLQRASGFFSKMEYVSMPIIMWIYFLITVFVLGMLIWNFVREKKSLNDAVLYLLVMIPLILRLLRIK